MKSNGRFQINAYACSDTGQIRPANEDSFFVANLSEGILLDRNGVLRFSSGPLGALFAVADGMGGAAAGEQASRMCLQTLYQEVQAIIREVRRLDIETLEQILMEAVGYANRRIYDMSSSNYELSGMGTTLTAVLEVSGLLITAQIGDSRAYLLSEEGILQLTRDQTLVAHKVSQGEITEDEARRHPERNVLLQAVGVKPSVELALRSAAVSPGDVILICSDGLHTQMTADEIFRVITRSSSPEDACLALVDLANNRGGPDNITSVLIQFLAN
jgi:protein phosphatase